MSTTATNIKINYKFMYNGSVMYNYYHGTISIEDIKSFWLDVIGKKVIHNELKGFIIDCRSAKFNIDADDTPELSQFFKDNLKVFRDKKFAYVTITPDQVVIPSLLQELDYNYESKPFSTTEAALVWLL